MFAKGFDQYIFAPHTGAAGGFIWDSSLYAKKMYLKDSIARPALGLDIIFNMKNGFTFMVNNNFMPVFLIDRFDDPYRPKDKRIRGMNMGFGVIGYIEFLFGYTHGIGSNFELTAGAGPAGLWPLAPALNARLSGSYYFNRKYGIFFGLGNSLGILPGMRNGGAIITNITIFSFGAAFRLN